MEGEVLVVRFFFLTQSVVDETAAEDFEAVGVPPLAL